MDEVAESVILLRWCNTNGCTIKLSGDCFMAIKMTSAILLSIAAFCYSSHVMAVSSKDKLKCSTYIQSVKNKNISNVKYMYTKLREKVVLFGYHALENILNDDRYKNISNPEGIAYEFHLITLGALKNLTPKSVLYMCSQNDSWTLESLGRATWLTVQDKMTKSEKGDGGN